MQTVNAAFVAVIPGKRRIPNKNGETIKRFDKDKNRIYSKVKSQNRIYQIG